MMRPGLLRLVGAMVLFGGCGPGGDGATEASSSGASTTGTTGAVTPTTGGTTEAPPATAECEVPTDCMLVDNCCECSARPMGAEVPACEGNCLQSTCDAELRGGIGVTCRSGRCVFAEVVCDGAVTCSDTRPSCPDGTQVSVKDDCWGPCVEARYCIGNGCPLDGCGEGWTCVAHQASGLQCVPVPLECGDTPTCECAAPYMSEFCLGACEDDGMGKLSCNDGG